VSGTSGTAGTSGSSAPSAASGDPLEVTPNNGITLDGSTSALTLSSDFSIGVGQLRFFTGNDAAQSNLSTGIGLIAKTPEFTSPATTAYSCYYLQSGAWALTDTSNEDKVKNCIGVALGLDGTGTGFLLDGWFKDSSTVPITSGSPLYLSGASGGFNSSPPGSGFVRLIGWVIENNIIYFRPDNTYIEL